MNKLILTAMLFSKIDVNKVEWLDLVFENRNQSYGAYVLRRDSGNYLFKSLLITGALFTGALLLSQLKSSRVDDSINMVSPMVNPDEIELTPIDIVKPTVTTPPSLNISTPEITTKSEVQQVSFSGNLTPVKDELIVKEVPTAKQIEESVVGLTDETGLTGTGSSNGANIDENTGGTGNGTAEGSGVYNLGSVEVMPEFPGGMKAWANFLNKNLYYPANARENGVSGRVVVSFVVEKNGQITDLKVIKGIGGGCDEEALRVIKKSPFWKPGLQNGRAVRVAYMMPIVFRME